MTENLTMPGGEQYQGSLKDGVPHGKGTMVLPDGSKYTGEFIDGEFHGFGTFTSSAGEYVGEWEKGVPHGEGTFTFSSGFVKKGKWQRGELIDTADKQKNGARQENKQNHVQEELEYDTEAVPKEANKDRGKQQKQEIVSFKLMPGRDDDLINWVNSLGKGEKSFHIRQALRERLAKSKDDFANSAR